MSRMRTQLMLRGEIQSEQLTRQRILILVGGLLLAFGSGIAALILFGGQR
jgi:hypothetical protein